MTLQEMVNAVLLITKNGTTASSYNGRSYAYIDAGPFKEITANVAWELVSYADDVPGYCFVKVSSNGVDLKSFVKIEELQEHNKGVTA